MINAGNHDLGFYEYNVSAVMDSRPSVQRHVLELGQIRVESISQHILQSMLLAGISRKLLATLYIPVVRIRDSSIHESELFVQSTIRISPVCIAYDGARMILPETGKKLRRSSYNVHATFRCEPDELRNLKSTKIYNSDMILYLK